MMDDFSQENVGTHIQNSSIDEQIFQSMTHGDYGNANPSSMFTEQQTMNGTASFNDFDGSSTAGPMGAPRLDSGLNARSTAKLLNDSGPYDNQIMGQNEASAPNTQHSDRPRSGTTTGETKQTWKSLSSPLTTEEEPAAQKLREKNRIAAKKCRDKKKIRHEELEQAVPQLSREKMVLMQEIQRKQADITYLRGLLDTHRDCHHPEHQRYFAAQVHQNCHAFQRQGSQLQAWVNNTRSPQVQHGISQVNNMQLVALQRHPGDLHNRPIQAGQNVGGHQMALYPLHGHAQLLWSQEQSITYGPTMAPLNQPQPKKTSATETFGEFEQQASRAKAVISTPLTSGFITDDAHDSEQSASATKGPGNQNLMTANHQALCEVQQMMEEDGLDLLGFLSNL